MLRGLPAKPPARHLDPLSEHPPLEPFPHRAYPIGSMADPNYRRIPRKLTPTKQAAYLKALEQHGEVSAGAAVVGVSRQCIYDRMEQDPAFRDACEQAQGRLDERIMATVEKLACEGTVTYTYGKNGEKATKKRVFSERIILAWLKRRDRAAWGDQLAVDKRVTGTVIHEQRIRVEDMSPTQLRAARAFVETLPRIGVEGAPDGGTARDVPSGGSE